MFQTEQSFINNNFSYEQDGWTDLLKSVDGEAITYDALGNMLSFDGYTYTWEAGRRLSQMTNGTEYIYLKNIQGDIEGILDQNGNLVVEYTYDACNQ